MTETDETSGEPVVEQLATIWGSIRALGEELTDAEWDTATDLPGWTVKDCLSHIVGTELMVMGEPAPDVPVDHLAHVRDEFGAVMETWVERRRTASARAVLDEMGEVTALRLEALRTLGDEQWEEIGWSPIGQVPYRDFMSVRAFDCWMHEQDMRRAVARPGHMTGFAPAMAVQRLGSGLGYVVGKRAAAPEGATVVIEVRGPGGDIFAVAVDKRAEPMDPPPTEPTVRLITDVETFCALGGGRWSAAERRDRVEIEGDEQLADRILSNMAVTP